MVKCKIYFCVLIYNCVAQITSEILKCKTNNTFETPAETIIIIILRILF